MKENIINKLDCFAKISAITSGPPPLKREGTGFTLAEVFHPAGRLLSFGFTLAEVLITLGIVGVVAAITLPNLIYSYQEKETVTRLKQVYSILSNAYAMILQEDGDPSNWGLSEENFNQITIDKFAKYIKNVKICKLRNSSCFPDPRLGMDGKLDVVVFNKQSALITPNGTVILFYTQSYDQISTGCMTHNHCIDIAVDINGNKGPNQWGRDTFVFHADKYKILPRGLAKTSVAATKTCSPLEQAHDGWHSGSGCTAWVLKEENLDYLKCLKGKTEYCNKKYYFE